MNTILSIDLDILFSPYIGIYNSLIQGLPSHELTWEFLDTQYNQASFFPNKEYYEILEKIIRYYSLQVNEVYIGEDHSSILTAIEHNKDIFTNPYQFNIYNIDFHHDITYQEKECVNNFDKKLSNCSDWVGFLNYHNFLNTYHWWHAPSSSFDKKLFNEEFINVMPKNFYEYDLENNFPLDLNIDMLYITFSTPWIPPCYYFVIKELLINNIKKEKMKYLPYSFIPGGFIKPFLNLSGNKSYEEFSFLINDN